MLQLAGIKCVNTWSALNNCYLRLGKENKLRFFFPFGLTIFINHLSTSNRNSQCHAEAKLIDYITGQTTVHSKGLHWQYRSPQLCFRSESI